MNHGPRLDAAVQVVFDAPAQCRRIAFGRYHDGMNATFRAVLSPCTGVCTLGEDGLCLGCHRTGDEIAAWATLGDAATSNRRTIYKYLVPDVLPTCQLVMGVTTLATGSVWNTMPAHTHSRRMEAYFYFELPADQAVCHLMGQPQETRHIWMKGNEAVLSPEWSIHSAAATHSYTFIWGMGGENLDYGDQDFCAITDLK